MEKLYCMQYIPRSFARTWVHLATCCPFFFGTSNDIMQIYSSNPTNFLNFKEKISWQSSLSSQLSIYMKFAFCCTTENRFVDLYFGDELACKKVPRNVK